MEAINDALRIETPAPSPWKTKIQIAQHFQMSERQITNLQRRNVLPYSKVAGGRSVRFHVQECDKAMKAMEIKSICFSS